MKKTFFIPFVMVTFLLGLVSCQREELGSISKKSFRISAEIEQASDNSTKVSYDVNNSANTITPAWTVDDEIIGFDNLGNTFTFTVKSVGEDGKATLDEGEYEPGEGATTLYAVYYPGKEASAFSGEGAAKTLAVDLSSQKGASLGDASPVLMCATAQIDPTDTKLIFENQTAIVGIKRMKIAASTTITSVKVKGLATAGTFQVVGGKMSLVPGETSSDVTIDTFNPALTSDSDGIIGTSDKPALMFVTLPVEKAKIDISATTSGSGEYNTLTTLKTDVEAGKYYYADKKFTTDVAAIGSTSYDCLSAAFGAAGTFTIKILKDCEADALLEVGDGKDVTLDLNGKTITISGDNTVEPKVANRIEVAEGGTLTITDSFSPDVASQGSIIAAEGTKGTSNVVAIGGTLTIAGGNIISNPGTDDVDAAVYVKGGATATISGGFIKGMGSEGALTVNTAVDLLQQNKKSSLTITGGSFEADSNTVQIYRSDASITGGKILATNTSSSKDAPKYAVKVSDKNNTTSVKGTVEIGGSVDIECKARQGICVLGNDSDESIVTISGGKVLARIPVFVDDQGRCDITGGEIRCEKNGWYMLTSTGSSKINISGGKIYCHPDSYLTSVGTGSTAWFSSDVISNKPFLNNRVKSGYVLDKYTGTDTECLFCLAQGDNSITAEVTGGAYHCTPAGAQEYVNNSSSAVTLTVAKDFSSDRIYFKKGRENLITLDLNGHTISAADNDQKYLVTSSSSITITDSSNPSAGLVEGVHSAVMVDSTATLTIAGGSFSGDGTYEKGSGVIYATGTANSLSITGGTITCTGTSGADSRAVNIGCDGIMTGGKIISKGSCLRMYENNIKFTVSGDNTQIISDVDATTTMLVATATGSELRIKGGYYYISGPSTPGESVAFQSNTARVLVQGGKMNVGSNKVTAAAGYKVSSLDPSETFEGKTYTYKVEEDTEAEAKAQVNGTNYPSLSDAYTAAMAISDSVTIKLLADATIIGRWDFNKQGTAGTCLDLNGHNISTAIDSVFTPVKPLTITDSNSGTKGTITSSKFCVLALNSTAYTTVNINNCTITSTSTATSVGNSLIRSHHTSSTNADKRIINIGENAKLIANRNAIYACRGTVNISSNAEITANHNNSNASAIYVYSGGKVNVSDNASLKGYNVFRSGSSNTATAVTINGGYFYAAGESGKIINFTSDYDAKFSFQGGYYNKEVNSTLYPKATIKAATTTVSPAATRTHGGESLSYGYQIQ